MTIVCEKPRGEPSPEEIAVTIVFLTDAERETVEAIFLNGSDAVAIRIPRDQIEEMQPSRVSIMPQGLDTQLTRGQLADLLAFLRSLR